MKNAPAQAAASSLHLCSLVIQTNHHFENLHRTGRWQGWWTGEVGEAKVRCSGASWVLLWRRKAPSGRLPTQYERRFRRPAGLQSPRAARTTGHGDAVLPNCLSGLARPYWNWTTAGRMFAVCSRFQRAAVCRTCLNWAWLPRGHLGSDGAPRRPT